MSFCVTAQIVRTYASQFMPAIARGSHS